MGNRNLFAVRTRSGFKIRYAIAGLLFALMLGLLAMSRSNARAITRSAWKVPELLQGQQRSNATQPSEVLQFLARVPTTGAADDELTLEEKQQLIAYVRRVAELCLSLCDTTRPIFDAPLLFLNGTDTGRVFRKTVAPVQCSALVSSAELDAPLDIAVSPKKIPAELISEFSMQDRVEISMESDPTQNHVKRSEPLVWSQDLVERYREMGRAGTLPGPYGIKTTNIVRAALDNLPISDSRALVVGSEEPWIESLLLNSGAKNVVTLGHGEILSKVPNLITMQPREFATKYVREQLEQFDVVFAFSSVEHSGLGRNGDALNPWADILSVAKLWCVTKPGGILVIQVPTGTIDVVYMNSQRMYGLLRPQYLMTNWDRIELHNKNPPSNIKVFRKPMQ
mmetsp:Transcript_6212/g.16586  ORF Transcript_6212/g.16586 Transcript_6212/m.16586 type:complete len:395 (-) Transcript_6212:998-2182(-)